MAEQAAALQRTGETTPLRPFRANFYRFAEEIHDSIARRAFEISEGHRGIHGGELEDWLKAENEVLHPIHLDLLESDGELIARAEVPGFSTNDIEISLEPRRLAITGRRETREERKAEKALYSETCANQVFRVIDLPAEVRPGGTRANLKDGVLEIAMPKNTVGRGGM